MPLTSCEPLAPAAAPSWTLKVIQLLPASNCSDSHKAAITPGSSCTVRTEALATRGNGVSKVKVYLMQLGGTFCSASSFQVFNSSLCQGCQCHLHAHEDASHKMLCGMLYGVYSKGAYPGGLQRWPACQRCEPMPLLLLKNVCTSAACSEPLCLRWELHAMQALPPQPTPTLLHLHLQGQSEGANPAGIIKSTPTQPVRSQQCS